MSDGTMLPDSGPRDEPRRGGDRMAFAASAGGAALRGALLIGAAIIIGIVLLQVVDDGGSVSAKPESSSTTPTTAPGSTVPGETTQPTDTTQPSGTARPPSEVAVKVYNGSGVAGAAKNMANKLKTAGYATGDGANAPADAPARRQGTIVACQAGYEADAAALAQQVGPTTKVEAFPTDLPGADGANCVVVLGT